jgi:predicted nuclease of predicted toxin-antitoxin system
MRFLADECVWRDVVNAIRSAGFECDWVHDISPSVSDRDVLKLSTERQLLLVSEDADFGELIFRHKLEAYGIVRVLLSSFEGTKREVAALVASRLTEIASTLPGTFTTIDPDRVRQRDLPVRSKAED